MSLVKVVVEGKENWEALKWTMELIGSVLGLKLEMCERDEYNNQKEAVVIYYGTGDLEGSRKLIKILPSGFFERPLLHNPLPEVKCECVEGKDRVLLYYQKDEGEWVQRQGDMITSKVDLLAGIFFMVGRVEEYLRQYRDDHGRFLGQYSWFAPMNLLGRPLANEYVQWLGEWIKELQPGIEFQQGWKGKEFALLWSYDVDVLGKYEGQASWRNLARELFLKRRYLGGMVEYLGVKTGLTRDPYWQFSEYVRVEKKRRIPATYMLMGSGGGETYSYYGTTDKKFRQLVRMLARAKRELGWHCGYESYLDKGRLSAEKKRLEALGIKAETARMHYLRFELPWTWRLMAELGVKSDSTLGFADRPGFRAGLCHPFRPFDPFKHKTINIWEIPLTVMDVSFRDYMSMGPEQAECMIKALIDEVKKHHGVMVFLWHNFLLGDDKSWFRLYLKILDYVQEQGAWATTPGELIKVWEEREAGLA